MSEPERDFLPLHRDGTVCVLTMNYPERRNAFSSAMRAALLERFRHLMYDDPSCRAIVLTGAAGTFCAGGDLSELKARPPISARQVLEVPRELIRVMVQGPKPVIAAVEGSAFGAGLSLACAADYVVAAGNARFCPAFLRVGLLPDIGSLWTLPRRVGAGKARELMMFASEIDAAAAHAIGLVDQLTEPGDALAAAMERARAFAALPAAAVAGVKAILGESAGTAATVLRAEADQRALLRLAAVERI